MIREGKTREKALKGKRKDSTGPHNKEGRIKSKERQGLPFLSYPASFLKLSSWQKGSASRPANYGKAGFRK